MKKIWIFIALLPCVALSLQAQKPAKTELTRVEMSLTECVAFAQENSPLPVSYTHLTLPTTPYV